MKLSRWAVCGLLAGVLAFGTGCQTMSDMWDWMFGGDEAPGDMEFIPGPMDGDPTGWTDGMPPIAGGEWTPIPGITFPPVYFAYDQFRIGASEQVKLEQVANYMMQNKGIGLIVEGHCDERGSVEYNRSLGERRAMAIRDYLVTLGVDTARMQTISFGEERPAEQGSSENTWAKNRRGETIPAKMN
jgi:peptidoglycan-associated lipoprotein